jgi:hypothetical protein
MAEVTLLKNTRRQAAIAAVGSGTFHCNLTSLLATVRSNATTTTTQTLSVPIAECSITDVTFSVDGNTTITRNNITYLILTEGQAELGFSSKFGYVLNPNTRLDSNANIQINFGANSGSVFMTLTKGPGFNDPDLQLLQDYERP